MRERQIAPASVNRADGREEGFWRSQVRVQEAGNKGQGVFAVSAIPKGQVVIVGKPVRNLPERTWQSLQVDAGKHIEVDEPFAFVNHSCDPSCGPKPNEYGGYNLVARRDLSEGDEVTFDYCMTEWACVGFSACRCGAERCRETIQGARALSEDHREEYKGFTAPYLQIFWSG